MSYAKNEAHKREEGRNKEAVGHDMDCLFRLVCVLLLGWTGRQASIATGMDVPLLYPPLPTFFYLYIYFGIRKTQE